MDGLINQISQAEKLFLESMESFCSIMEQIKEKDVGEELVKSSIVSFMTKVTQARDLMKDTAKKYDGPIPPEVWLACLEPEKREFEVKNSDTLFSEREMLMKMKIKVLRDTLEATIP